MQSVVRSAIDYGQLKQVAEDSMVEIVVKEEHIDYLPQLLNFGRNGILKLPISVKHRIEQMWQTSSWGDSVNRTFRFSPGHSWDRHHFEGRSRSYLVSLKVECSN